MDLWKSLGGMVEVSLTSADPAAALRAVSAAGITVYSADRPETDITARFRIRRRDYRKLKALADRHGYDLKMVRLGGIYWTAKGLLRRPVLLAGILILLVLVMYLPSRVFFFRVEGNETIPTRLILEKCQACGISFGASRRAVRSEKMKNALLEAIPQLQWAGVNTSGCVATITVRERSLAETKESAAGVSSIVAARDGVIAECTVTKGNPICKVGQAVKAGEVLVSGYTDCGICIRATRAEAEIYAFTQRKLSVVTPANWQKRGEAVRQEKKYAVIIGKKRINFYKGSGISDTGCDKMYEESYVTLPGGFQLPVILVTEVWTYYDYEETAGEEEYAAAALSEFAESYLTQRMIAGQILSRAETVSEADGVFCLEGNYACLEMIGQVRSEEIITPNGNNN